MATINGTSGKDKLKGKNGDDTINGKDGDDVLIGAGGNDILNGGDDDDKLTGSDGLDTLNGGPGDDQLTGSAGADTLNGDDGIDTIKYSASAASVTVNLLTKTASGGDAQGDSFSGIENVSGSNVPGFGDSLTGDDSANVLSGLAGSDTLSGGLGNDTLVGGTGFDRLIGGANDDLYEFQSGEGFATEILDASGSDTIAIAGNLFKAGAGPLQNVRRDVGTDDLQFIFDGGANFVIVDHLDGDKVETLTDTAGHSFAIAASTTGTDGADLMLADDGDTSGGKGNDLMFVGESQTAAGEEGNDVLIASGDDATLLGNAGNDTLDGSQFGNTRVSYFGVASAMNVDLAAGTAKDGDGGTDTLIGIERLTLTILDDTFSGADASEVVSALDGQDQLSGKDGDDFLSGGSGADTINGGAGKDEIEGDNGNDRLTGGKGQDSFDFDIVPNGTTNQDTITDMTPGTDQIRLDNDVFGGLGAGGVPLAAGAFNTGSAATEADDRIIYNSATGELIADSDGKDGSAGIVFAVLDPGLALTNNDIFVLD